MRAKQAYVALIRAFGRPSRAGSTVVVPEESGFGLRHCWPVFCGWARPHVLLARGTFCATIPRTMPKRKTKARRPARRKERKKLSSGGKLPKDAVTRMVFLRAREGQELLLEAELRALIGPSRKEEGCLTFDLHAAMEQPGSYLLHEVWASREAHTEHTHTPHFLRWDARKDALITTRDGAFWKQIA